MMKIHLRGLEHVEHLTKLLPVFAPGHRSPSALPPLLVIPTNYIAR